MTEHTNQIEAVMQPSKDFNVMQIRLDTEQVLDRISKTLIGGYFYTYQDEKGSICKEFIKTGNSIVNFIGHAELMNTLELHINTQVAQGNFPTKNKYSERFETMLYKFQEAFGSSLISNKHEWEYDAHNHQLFVASIRDAVEMFLSRCLDNLERTSYGETTKSVESTTIGQNKAFFGKT